MASSRVAPRLAVLFAALFALLALLAPPPADAAVALKFSDTAPPHSTIARFFERWTAAVSKVDPSVVTMKAYHNTLGNVRTNYDSVVNGVADVGWFNPEYYAGKFPHFVVSTLPYMAESATIGSVALWRMYRKHYFDTDFNEVRLIAVHTYPGTVIHAEFPIKSIDDLKGRKLAIQSKEIGEAVTLLGATPVSLPLPSVYPAAQRHLVQGIAVGWAAVEHFKLYEVSRWHIEVNLGGANAVVAVGNRTWAKWPDAVKKIVMSKAGERLSRSLGAFWDHETRHNQEVVGKMAGQHDVALPPAEIARLQKTIAPAAREWMSSTSGAAKLVAAYKAEYAKAAAEMK